MMMMMMMMRMMMTMMIDDDDMRGQCRYYNGNTRVAHFLCLRGFSLAVTPRTD